MKIYESAEDYLETILKLHRKSGAVRSIDIVNELGYSKPSVSVAMKKLRAGGYIRVDEDGFLHLTPSGEEVANRVYTRHQLLTRFLVSLGVSEEIAAEDACRIEHDISAETFGKIKEYMEKSPV
ncbi:MAG: metal-dependent transcriptional regulator [Ruminococcaceae bacterium]|nr:metal-dependent transcriptional regulator [Oscillospiraceae bacterium]